MKKTIKGLTFAAMLALTLVVSTSSAFAKDSKSGRETAWTDVGPRPIPQGVTWENIFNPFGVTWEK